MCIRLNLLYLVEHIDDENRVLLHHVSSDKAIDRLVLPSEFLSGDNTQFWVIRIRLGIDYRLEDGNPALFVCLPAKLEHPAVYATRHIVVGSHTAEGSQSIFDESLLLMFVCHRQTF